MQFTIEHDRFETEAEAIAAFTADGLHVVPVDFPAQIGDRVVLLCWLEGEERVEWFHDEASGFPGRRPLAELHDPA